MPRVVTDEHKAAMKRGRQVSAVVDAYLKVVDQPKRRGRPISLDELNARRAKATDELAVSEGLARLKLLQTIRDLEERISTLEQDNSSDLQALEQRFVEVGSEFAASQGIDYSTFRDYGVPADVLKRAGIRQTRRRTSR